MRIASSEFADDPCSSVKRGTMVRAARALLSAVTRLLILADMADVMRLLAHLKIVRLLINQQCCFSYAFASLRDILQYFKRLTTPSISIKMEKQIISFPAMNRRRKKIISDLLFECIYICF